MLQILLEKRIDELTGHFFVVISLDLFGFGLLKSHFLLDDYTMIEKHLHTVCSPHKRNLIAGPNGGVNEYVVSISLNTVGNRFNRNLYYIEPRGFDHTSKSLTSATHSNNQMQYRHCNSTSKTTPKHILSSINKFLLRRRSICYI